MTYHAVAIRRLSTVGLGLLIAASCACPLQRAPNPPRRSSDATAFLDTLEHRTFNFFWETANPHNGLVPDRWPTPSFSSIAAVGFGLTAYVIGAERGYVSREQARSRVLSTLRSLYQLPQGPEPTGVAGYKGFFYHFLDMQSGARYKQVELSTIDTALLLAGVLTCRRYFDSADSSDVAIRAYADSLYSRVDWTWIQPRPPLVSMGWTPEQGFHTYDWRGYDEAMLLYVLALGSPTHPIDSAAWGAWTSGYKWGTYYDESHVGFAPLFGHQYSHIWIDFHGIRDAYMRAHGTDYFENSRRATIAQHRYAMDNPERWIGYDSLTWGLSASDGPTDAKLPVHGETRDFFGYAARGVDFTEVRDDGTIAPTAAGASIVFAPEIVIPTLVAMRDRYGDNLFRQYGFVDAFNPTFRFDVPVQQGHVVPNTGWFDDDYLGIDQGPIIAMIENYRTGLLWRLMRGDPAVVRGLQRAGFTGGWLAAVQ